MLQAFACVTEPGTEVRATGYGAAIPLVWVLLCPSSFDAAQLQIWTKQRLFRAHRDRHRDGAGGRDGCFCEQKARGGWEGMTGCDWTL